MGRPLLLEPCVRGNGLPWRNESRLGQVIFGQLCETGQRGPGVIAPSPATMFISATAGGASTIAMSRSSRRLAHAASALTLVAAACGGSRLALPDSGATDQPPPPAFVHAGDTSDAGHNHVGGASSELERMLAEVREATVRYRDIEVASADGYIRFGNIEGPLMGEHWYHPDLVQEPFDHRRPSTLMYATIAGERVLVGVAYTVYRRPEDPMPEGFPGNADAWHIHDLEEIAHAMTEGRPVARWLVNRRLRRGKVGGGDGRTQLTMLHAWVWLENPAFVFANEHRALPYLRAGLPAEYADGARLHAANGVALLLDTQCQREREILEKVARVEQQQGAGLRQACAHAEATVRNAFASRPAAPDLNGTAAAAWRRYEAAKESILTAEQVARLTAWVDHPRTH